MDNVEITSSSIKVRFDEILVLAFFAFLIIAGFATRGPGYQALNYNGLAYYTVVGLFCLILIAIPVSRIRSDSSILARLASAWWPLVLGLIAYETLKHIHANRITEALGILPKDHLMLALDRLLFGAALPLKMEWMVSDWLSDVMWFSYLHIYYLTPVVFLAYFYFASDSRAFFVVRRAILWTLFGGYVLYLLVPVAGPLFLIGDRFTVPISGGWGIRTLVWDTLRYNWDCFPSLHTAVPWVVAITAYRYSNPLVRTISVVSAVLVSLSTVYLRFHYGIDVIAGAIWAILVGWLVLRTRHRPFAVDVEVRCSDERRLALKRWTLGAVFVVTGAVGLVVEQVFEKLLSTVVGASGPAAAIVLATYFSGIAIGGFLYARFGRRVTDPLRLYGGLELFVGAWALVLYFLFPCLQGGFSSLLGFAGDNSAVLFGLRIVASMFWILPPTIAMGATFPAIIGGLRILGFPEPRRDVVLFYALNLVGATLGAVAAPYQLFPELGLSGTLLLCALAELGVFMVALSFPRGRVQPPGSTLAETTAAPGGAALIWTRNLSWVAVLAFFSGFVFFSIEVLWVHLISVVVGTSVYAFSNMLFCVLLGLLFGSTLIRVLFRRQATLPTWFLALVLGLASLAIGFWKGYWDQVPSVFLSWGLGLSTFSQGEVLRVLCCLWLIVPTATLLGMVFPLIFRIDIFPVDERDRAAGVANATNAIGSFSGALVTGFVLLPVFGSEAVMLLLALLTATAGAALAFRHWSQVRRETGALLARGCLLPAAILLTCLLAIVVNSQRPLWNRLALTSGANVYFRPGYTQPQSNLLFWHEDMIGGITTVVENGPREAGEGPYRVLLTDGKFQGNDSWEMPAQTGFALVPLLYAPRFDRALVIGLGTGHSARTISAAGFKGLDIAEISPGIVDAARTYFAKINGRVLDRNNVTLILDDGRNALARRHRRYDLISMEISSMWFAGATNLYSQEFYAIAKTRLTEGGVLQQWLQLHHTSPLEVDSVVATMASEFRFVEFWFIGNQGVLVASEAPLVISPDRLEYLEHREDLTDELSTMKAWGYGDLRQFLGKKLLTTVEVRRLAERFTSGGGPLNTDMNRFIEYYSPRYNLRRENFIEINLSSLLRYVKPGARERRYKLVTSSAP